VPTVVTRFAPSPTGALHIGGARTALFSWAHARHAGGKFYLRFEDTDRERSRAEFEAVQLEALEWLGIDHDPVPGQSGIPRQSERAERYGEILRALLASGAAYRCACTGTRLEQVREQARSAGQAAAYDSHCRELAIGADSSEPFCVRLAIPEDGSTHWIDAIAGPSGQAAADLGDFVIARSDGTPIYHLAVVVDDHDMGVTHVIRGREHMTSTPRQLLIFEALGWDPPTFAHAPLLVGPTGKKLSKRESAVSVQSFRDRGFPAEAVLNFIARLGWGHGDLELVTQSELVEIFELSDVGISASQINDEKLHWISQHYIKTLPMPELRAIAEPFLEAEAGRPVTIDAGLEQLIDLLRERSKTLVELAERARFYWTDEIEFEPKAARKQLTAAAAAPLEALRQALGGLSEWTEASIEPPFHQVVAAHEIALGKLAQPVRVAIVGGTSSPGIFETLALLGRDRSLARIDAALAHIAAGAEASDAKA
jgi:glutamyl-tRNA synthetase